MISGHDNFVDKHRVSALRTLWGPLFRNSIKRAYSTLLSIVVLASTVCCTNEYGAVIVSVQPPDAQVEIRDTTGRVHSIAQSGKLVAVEAGDYVVHASKVRYLNATRTINVVPHATITTTIELQEEPDFKPLPFGQLKVSRGNPRYFTDESEHPIYLAGSHTWNNLVDMGEHYPPPTFDFEAYLDFLELYRHNFTRLWAWNVVKPKSQRYIRRQYASPQPWQRTGPGDDVTGLPKFDLSKHNEAYFTRMRERLIAAQQRGIYVCLMLFEGWAVQFAPGNTSHPFNRLNNINSIYYGKDPKEIHTLKHLDITIIQKAYIRKVVDTINDLDNVIYEIANEAGPYSTAWQYQMIEYLREYEATKPKQHPVGMTFQFKGGLNTVLFESAADWFSPGPESGNYRTNPDAADGRKVIITDTDHLGLMSREWVWKSFTRGLNILFMDRYVLPDSVTDKLFENADEIRKAIGDTLAYAERLDLSEVTPEPDFASSRYAIASNDQALVFVPGGGSVTVDLTRRSGDFIVEWYDCVTGHRVLSKPILGGEQINMLSPFSGDTVLYLYRPLR